MSTDKTYLLKLTNNDLIDVSRVAYIGEVDTVVTHSVKSTVTYHFPIVVSGNLISIKGQTKDEVNAMRQLIVSKLDVLTE